ncbi:MAG TPA: alpha/beta hydrolase [Opitutaceae bacterium]|nr:alpha/beta hydrolase [Opitutaceae bacterium]
MTRQLFLPGAGGSAAFWLPVAQHLPPEPSRYFFSWPGLGHEPPEPGIDSIDSLVTRVLNQLDAPADLIAQSLGGVVALRVALAAPEKVRRLVLAVTSGGISMADHGAADWRGDYHQAFPQAAAWIMDAPTDISTLLGRITHPTLLLWGDHDPISPVSMGRYLEQHLPSARLEIIPGADHDLAQTHAQLVAHHVLKHLSEP